MTKFVVNKAEITKKVLSILNDGVYIESDFEVALFKWWSNVRSDGGLKLTEQGDSALKQANLESFGYNFTINDFSLTSGILLKFDRYMPCPYYIDSGIVNRSFVRVYDSRVAILIGLHGNVIKYLDSLDVKRADLSISGKLLA